MATEQNIGPILEKFQRTEITEHHIYSRLARVIKSPENAKILQQIADDELRHYHGWKKYSGRDVKPDWIKMWFYYLISRVFGFTFGIKLMERGEEAAQKNYAQISSTIPEAEIFMHEENVHEEQLIGMLDEERLRYAGSVVLGLNDALVELTGALAGLTLALQNGKLIALSGLITGIAASLSMAASEYLSTRSEKTDKHPVRAGNLHGHRVRYDSHPARPALSAQPRNIPARPCHRVDDGSHHHRGIQLLHLRRQGRILPRAIRGDGRLEPERGGVLVRYRLLHPLVAGD